MEACVESTNKPTALILTRQDLPTLKDTDKNAYEGVSKGAYVVSPAERKRRMLYYLQLDQK